MRFLAPVAIGLLFAATFVACFIDPNPPHPHGDAGSSDDFLHADGGGNGGEGGGGGSGGEVDGGGGEADQ